MAFFKMAGTEHPGGALSRPTVAIPIIGVLAIIAAAVYYIGGPEKPTTLAPEASPEATIDAYAMICKKCGARFDLKRSEFTTWPQNEHGYQCPKCKAYNTEPDNSKAARMPADKGG
ncbi:MAG: hypothetical protein AMXMBFR47_32100 [Planctomycetota bacterium]